MGDIACAVSYNGHALEVFDVSDPGAPESLAVLNLGDDQSPNCVTMDGAYTYVANTSYAGAGLQIIDLSIPVAPSIAGSYAITSQFAYALTVKGDYTYVANSDGFDVVNIATKSAPVGVRNINTIGYGWSVAVSGSQAFVACENGLTVIDISTPVSASLVGIRGLESGANGVCVPSTVSPRSPSARWTAGCTPF